jgi:3-hydroxyisobutyrate dehydrogenase
MSSFNENPKVIFNNIKELLNYGVKERNNSFHIPVFSNIEKDNSVNSRIVVLRKFDETKLILNFHTDLRSMKLQKLKEYNNSFFVFYDFKLKIQLRIKTLSSINNNNFISKQAWEKTGLFSRKCYLSQKAPSSLTKIPEDGLPDHLKGIDPTKEESEKGYKNFTVIENEIKSIDWLYLASSGHKRLKINFEECVPFYEWLIP